MLGADRPSELEITMKKTILAAIAVLGVLGAGYAISHSGGLDQYGCHTDHKKGDYHCHK